VQRPRTIPTKQRQPVSILPCEKRRRVGSRTLANRTLFPTPIQIRTRTQAVCLTLPASSSTLVCSAAAVASSTPSSAARGLNSNITTVSGPKDTAAAASIGKSGLTLQRRPVRTAGDTGDQRQDQCDQCGRLTWSKQDIPLLEAGRSKPARRSLLIRMRARMTMTTSTSKLAGRTPRRF